MDGDSNICCGGSPYLPLTSSYQTSLGKQRFCFSKFTSSGRDLRNINIEMPGLDIPVCFARAAPFNVSSRQLVFYDVIDVELTSKCSVLSCIAKVGGAGRLPDAITLSDFKQWMAAVEDTRGDVRKSYSRLSVSCPRYMCICILPAPALLDGVSLAVVALASDHISVLDPSLQIWSFNSSH